MLRRAATTAVLLAVFAAPAHAQPTTLMPGVTYDKTVQFTPHGAVVLHVITAPRPGEGGGLYALTPVLARGTILGGRQRLTQIEKDVSAGATVVGINGDLFKATDASPAGIVMSGGVLSRRPSAGRSSIGVDTAGALHVDRLKFFGTWKGTGQRRPLVGLNETPIGGQVVLFTPAYGRPVPRVPGAAEVVLQPFPATAPNTDLTATVAAVGAGGGETIPPDGAVLMAAGSAAKNLQAEAPAGTPMTLRLILQPAWTGMVAALGGGPLLVRNGKAIFRSLEDFTNEQVAARSPRAGVGQLADGRVILVAVDGRQPGYSVGLTSFELAQTMQRLGAVTAAAVDPGDSVTAAFDGQLLSKPSDPTGERAVKEALLVEYFGVYAAEPPLPLLTGEPGKNVEPLSYKIVRQSTVTAQLVGPDNVPRVLESTAAHPPGSYPLTFTAYDAEGSWRFVVQASDDLGRVSTIERAYRYDTTLKALAAPRVATGRATVRFTLARAATVRMRIETKGGVVVRALPAVTLQPGAQQVVWDGRLPHGTRAYGGTYVAHLTYTSSVGTSDVAVQFGFRRGG
jgi:hypothetical protein